MPINGGITKNMDGTSTKMQKLINKKDFKANLLAIKYQSDHQALISQSNLNTENKGKE